MLLTTICDVGHGVALGIGPKLAIKVNLMPKDDRDLLEVLKFELEFLEQGGYGRLPREAWRPRFIFEDSPTCMNFNSKDREPCSECLLMQFVPENARTEQTPCIHIPLSPSGETLDSLYRTGTQLEIEEALGMWLRTTIQRLEAKGANSTLQVPPKAP
jgi:hypothetical protein